MQAKPSQFVVKNPRRFRVGKITIGDSPVGDRPRDPMNELSHRGFAPAFGRIRPVREIAIEILRDRYLGRQRAPSFRNLDVLLLKDYFSTIVRDFSSSTFPFDFVERCHCRTTENALEPKPGGLLFWRGPSAVLRQFSSFSERCGCDSGLELDDGFRRVEVVNCGQY